MLALVFGYPLQDLAIVNVLFARCETPVHMIFRDLVLLDDQELTAHAGRQVPKYVSVVLGMMSDS